MLKYASIIPVGAKLKNCLIVYVIYLLKPPKWAFSDFYLASRPPKDKDKFGNSDTYTYQTID